MKLAERSFSSQIAREPSLEKPSFRPTRGRAPPLPSSSLSHSSSRFSGGSAPPPASSRWRRRTPPLACSCSTTAAAPPRATSSTSSWASSPPRRRATPRPRTWASCRASPGSWRRFKTRWTPPTPRATTSLPPGAVAVASAAPSRPPPTAPLPHQTLRTRDRRIACRMCEPHVWFALALHSRAAPPSAVRDGALHALLERLHADFVFANGTVAALLAADASGGAARDALAPYVADLGARLRPRGGPGWGAGHGALRSEALALNPATPAFADPPSLAGVSEARGGERERLAFAPLSEARDREADREVALAVAACAEVSEAYDRDADADEGSRARPPRALIRGAAVLADDRVVWATTDLRAALGRARRSERSDFFVPESEARAASESPSSLDEKEAAFDARRSASETAAFARYAVRCLAPGTDARHTRAFAEAVRAEADEATRRLDEWVRDARRAGGGAEGGDAEVRARVRARPPPFMASEWTDEADPNPNNPNPNDPNPNPNDPNSDPTTRPPPPSPPPPSPPPPSPPPVRVVRRSARARVGASRADPDPSAAADPSASRVAVWTTTGSAAIVGSPSRRSRRGARKTRTRRVARAPREAGP